jgi:hypothetical protein
VSFKKRLDAAIFPETSATVSGLIVARMGNVTESIQDNEPRRPFRFLRKAIIGVIVGPIVMFVFLCLVIVKAFERLAPGKQDEPESVLISIALVLMYLGFGILIISALYLLWWVFYWITKRL